MAIWLHFSFWGLSFDISALFRLSESGGRLLVTNGFHIGRAEFSVVIDRLTVLVDGFAVDSGIALNCVPLTAAGILEDLIVTTRCGISGDIIELRARAILVPDFKVAVLTVCAINLRNRKIITGHKVLECRLIISSCGLANFKLGNVALLLHGIPIHTVGRLHDAVGRIGFLIIGAVVPERVASIRGTGFDNAVAHGAQGSTLRCAGEGCCHKGRLGIESLTNVFSMICKLSAVLGRLAKATRICSTKVLCFGGVAVNGIHGGSAVAVSNGRLISSAHRGCGNSCKQGTLRSRGIRCTNSVCCAGVSHHAGMAFNAIVGKRLAEALAAFAGLRCSGHAITCCCVGDICSNTMEGGYIVKGAAALAAGHLIPLASIRRSNHAVGNFWLFKLRGVEHIHRSRFAIRGNCGRTDMASCDLRSLKLESLHLGHIVAKAPVRYITGNRAGSAGRSGRYRGNGVPIQGSTIPGGDTTEGAANESGTAIEAHAGATFYNGITDIGVGAESGTMYRSTVSSRSLK